jgi:hypothetical protein
MGSSPSGERRSLAILRALALTPPIMMGVEARAIAVPSGAARFGAAMAASCFAWATRS